MYLETNLASIFQRNKHLPTRDKQNEREMFLHLFFVLFFPPPQPIPMSRGLSRHDILSLTLAFGADPVLMGGSDTLPLPETENSFTNDMYWNLKGTVKHRRNKAFRERRHPSAPRSVNE